MTQSSKAMMESSAEDIININKQGEYRQRRAARHEDNKNLQNHNDDVEDDE